MKNSLLLIMFLSLLANSQTHRFIYDVEYKKDSTSSLVTKENYILDVNKSEVLYYTRDFFIADSLINSNIPFPKELRLNTSTIISHEKGNNNYGEYDLLENTVLKLQTVDTQPWKLTADKKQIKNLKLQKAVATWGGRNWIAWFAPDIPFQEGPYKFHGLPGLIVQLYDDRNNYRFELVKSEKRTGIKENQFIAVSRQMAVPVTWEKYRSTKIKYYESPVSFIQNGIGDSKNEEFFLNDGTKVNQGNLREVNESLRNNIRKYNNPIELDKAIIYPIN